MIRRKVPRKRRHEVLIRREPVVSISIVSTSPAARRLLNGTLSAQSALAVKTGRGCWIGAISAAGGEV